MKKYIAIIITLVMLFCFCACSNSTSNESETTTTTTTTTVANGENAQEEIIIENTTSGKDTSSTGEQVEVTGQIVANGEDYTIIGTTVSSPGNSTTKDNSADVEINEDDVNSLPTNATGGHETAKVPF